MKNVRWLSLSVMLSLSVVVVACGGGADVSGDAGPRVDGEDASIDGTDASTGVRDASAGTATLRYDPASYAFLAPGTLIVPIAPTAAGDAPLAFRAEGLPIGLAIDERTGVISGAPGDPSSFRERDVRVVVRDAAGSEAEASIHLTLGSTGLTDHQVDMDTSGCAYDCVSVSGDTSALHVGDTVTWSGDQVEVAPADGISFPTLFVGLAGVTLGINGSPGTSIPFEVTRGSTTVEGTLVIVP